MDNHRQPARIRKTRVLHPCPQCGKAFTKRSNMLIHARLHTGEKPYVCKFAGCGRSYKWLSSINFHEGRCDKRSAGLAVPAPRPPPPPAAAEAARVAAAAAAAAAAATTNPPHIPPIHDPAHLQPLPSYESLQRTTQSRGPAHHPPPPPPPLRPPPQFTHHPLSHQQHPDPSSAHPSFQQSVFPTHPQDPHAQQLPYANLPPANSPSPPNLHSPHFHNQQQQQPQQQQQVFRTPPKGKRFRTEVTPMSPVTPQAAALQGPALMSYPTPPQNFNPNRSLCGLNTFNLMKSSPTPIHTQINSTISTISPDPTHLQTNPTPNDAAQIVREITSIPSSKRIRLDHQLVMQYQRHATPATTQKSSAQRMTTTRNEVPGSPDSATTKEVKEMLAPYAPYNLLGNALGDLAASTSETTRVEPPQCYQQQQQPTVRLDPKQEGKLESKVEIGDSFGFEDEDFLQNCGIPNVLDDLDREAYGIALEQCSSDSDAIPMFR